MGKKFEYRLFFKYLFMYLCAVGAFAILMIPVYNATYRSTKEVVVTNESDKISNMVQALDKTIEAMTSISEQIKNDSSFLKLSKIDRELEASEYVYLIQAQEKLNELRRQYDIDLYAYVLFEKNNSFISDMKISPDYNSIFQNHLFYDTMTSDFIRNEALKKDKNITFLPVQKITYLNGESFNGLSCIVRVINDRYRTHECSIIYTINIDSLLKELRIQGGQDEFIQLIDMQKNVIFNYNYNGEALPNMESDIHNYEIDGEAYLLIQQQTEYGYLQVTKGMKTVIFENMIDGVLRIIKVYILAALFLSLIVSGWMSFKQFKGIRSILSIIKPPRSRQGNEYKYIYSSVKNLSNENRQYAARLCAIKESMRNRLIEKMFLQGIYFEKEKGEFFKYIGQKIEFFCVVNISIVGDDREEVTDDYLIEYYERIIPYIKNQINKKFHNTISFDNGFKEIIILIPLYEKDHLSLDPIYSFMKNMVYEIFSTFGQPLEIGISNIGYDIINVHACYLQAKRAIRQISDLLEVPVNRAGNHSDDEDLLEEFNIEQQLFELILMGEKEAIHSLFQRLNRHIKNYSFTSEQEIMQNFFRIRSPIFHARKKVLKDEQSVDIPVYSENDTITRLLEKLETAAIELCNSSIQKKEKAKTSLTSAVTTYIDRQYADPNLCANMVAGQFSVSEKYIFRIVKEETGLSFGKYVESLRIQKAKDLLKNTELSAAEIAKMIGFSSITTFYKAFNRVVGIAPIAWRESQSGH